MRVAEQHHMSDEQIENYSLGRVSEEECEQFEEHLLICESCQMRVTETDEYVAAMAGAGRDLRRQPQRQKWQSLFQARWTPMFAAAAMVLVLAALGVRLADRGTAPAAVSVNLQATRGVGIASKVPAGRPIQLGLDLAGLQQRAAYRVSVVDRFGREQWTGVVEAHAAQGRTGIPAMTPGVYFVRVYDGGATLLREYGLEVTAK